MILILQSVLQTWQDIRMKAKKGCHCTTRERNRRWATNRHCAKRWWIKNNWYGERRVRNGARKWKRVNHRVCKSRVKFILYYTNNYCNSPSRVIQRWKKRGHHRIACRRSSNCQGATTYKWKSKHYSYIRYKYLDTPERYDKRE